VVHLSGKMHGINRLVALYFIPNPENKPYVDHIDGNPDNNCVTNLRWATPTENQANKGKQSGNYSSLVGGEEKPMVSWSNGPREVLEPPRFPSPREQVNK
jgi:hypothetical protein